MNKLLWSEEIGISDLEEFTAIRELEGDDHATETPITVGKLAFVGTDLFYESVRGSRERAIRFLQFILDYVSKVDDSWNKSIEVECACGQKHSIIPCDWLAWLRDRDWVPRRKGHDSLNTESFAFLTRHDRTLAETAIREEHAEFLDLIGINVLEQALLATSDTQRAELRRKLAQLTRLASEHPDTVTRLMQDIEAHSAADKRWRGNQQLGKVVEDLVRNRLKILLTRSRVRVETHFVGYDLDAFFEDPSISDVGLLNLDCGTVLAKVEIKATRGTSVSMSNRQGDEATNDSSRYWLCVVKIDADADIASLSTTYVEGSAWFVPKIGARIAPALGGIAVAVRNADQGGLDLEHVEEIRYGIRSGVWANDGISLEKFVESISKEALKRSRGTKKAKTVKPSKKPRNR